MKLTDVHTHTTFSSDGRSSILEMLEKARSLPLAIWGVSEHFDYDYFVNGISFDGEPAIFTDAEKYFFTARALQDKIKDVKILVGCEFGFTTNKAVLPFYKTVLSRFQPDFVVNSVHTDGKVDFYESPAFLNKDKEQVFGEYLDLVRKSLDADYDYDIVGHLGYVCRMAPYQDKAMRFEEFKPQLTDILKTIIQKGKILEVNSSVKDLKTEFLPFADIVSAYYSLGGRKISFASDAHHTDRLAFNRDQCIAILKEIGFDHVTVPMQKQELKIEL